MSDVNDMPPEVTGEQPAKDPSVVGTLTQQEVQVLSALRQQGNQVTLEIGNLEVRKARLLGNLSNLEAQAQSLLNEAGKRLGVPEGQPWHVTPDGTVRLVPGQGLPNG